MTCKIPDHGKGGLYTVTFKYTLFAVLTYIQWVLPSQLFYWRSSIWNASKNLQAIFSLITPVCSRALYEIINMIKFFTVTCLSFVSYEPFYLQINEMLPVLVPLARITAKYYLSIISVHHFCRKLC